jgi:hypothetical protein
MHGPLLNGMLAILCFFLGVFFFSFSAFGIITLFHRSFLKWVFIHGDPYKRN